MRWLLSICVLLAAQVSTAAEFAAHRDLPYTDSGNPLHRLDVYAPKEGSNLPVAIWIHGGGWRRGDKAGVTRKPAAFTERGVVLVSINYRFVPDVTLEEMMSDVAAAVRWVRDHASEYGGDPNRIVVVGHSAGAHLAALLCTDDRYLKAAGVPLSAIRGCVPVDTAVFDVPARVRASGNQVNGNYLAVFGRNEELQKRYSPATYVAPGKQIPPFLILHVADRADSRAQAEQFSKVLREANVDVEVVAAEGKTHGTIATDLGLPDDVPTRSLYKFFDSVLASGQ